MTLRKSLLVLTFAASSLYASQAGAFFRGDERPPPNGLNGVSLNGMADQKLAADREISEAAAPKAVVLPDGSRVVVK
jgi:hypothetical protein